LQLEKSFQKQNFAHFDTIEHTSENFTLNFTQERHYYKKEEVILTRKSNQEGLHLDRHKKYHFFNLNKLIWTCLA